MQLSREYIESVYIVADCFYATSFTLMQPSREDFDFVYIVTFLQICSPTSTMCYICLRDGERNTSCAV